MLWRSSYHRTIAQLADFVAALISFISAYIVSNILHEFEPSIFPPKEEIRTYFIILILVHSFIYEILFDQQKAYSYQQWEIRGRKSQSGLEPEAHTPSAEEVRGQTQIADY